MAALATPGGNVAVIVVVDGAPGRAAGLAVQPGTTGSPARDAEDAGRDGAVCVDAEVRLAALSSTPQSVNQLIDHISMF